MRSEQRASMCATFIIGDIHGHRERLAQLLRDAELTSKDGSWAGEDKVLWFMGDLVDHGPDGIGAIELVMGLQQEAAAAGGRVGVLLGNHDALLLAADRFGDACMPGAGKTFREVWEESGGQEADLAGLTPRRREWLEALPAMAREGDHLLAHADALLYTRYGSSVEEVNTGIAALLQSDDASAWADLLNAFGEHSAFVDPVHGGEVAAAFLDQFGGEMLVHGHTPISKMTGQPAEAVREPMRYAEDRCVNVDSGLYLGGPGFVYRIRG